MVTGPKIIYNYCQKDDIHPKHEKYETSIQADQRKTLKVHKFKGAFFEMYISRGRVKRYKSSPFGLKIKKKEMKIKKAKGQFLRFEREHKVGELTILNLSQKKNILKTIPIPLHKTNPLKNLHFEGHLGGSIKCLTLGFGLGHDLVVC